MSPPPRKPEPPKDLGPARSRGALLGLAIGDALGATNEFKRLSSVPFPKMNEGPVTELVGGGPHRVKPGQVTDDTQMACCLSSSLRIMNGFNAEDALARYRAWVPHAFDIGNQTQAALSNGYPPDLCGKQVWLASQRKAAGNGSLMRTTPIGVFFAKNREELIRVSMEDSALTHFDPRCQLACAALNGAIAAAINARGPLKPEALVTAAESTLTFAAARLAKPMREWVREVQEASDWLREDLKAARKDDPDVYASQEFNLFDQQGYVRLAFRLAFWELLHAPTFEAGVTDIANRGGDSDTNAAIAGALLGAFHGEEAIPHRWKSALMEALSGYSTPLATTYHPRELLLLVP
jgi:ADP-ribosyl-[dinitrogen reductase] hydrolase